jgi:hypothetical protein
VRQVCECMDVRQLERHQVVGEHGVDPRARRKASSDPCHLEPAVGADGAGAHWGRVRKLTAKTPDSARRDFSPRRGGVMARRTEAGSK